MDLPTQWVCKNCGQSNIFDLQICSTCSTIRPGEMRNMMPSYSSVLDTQSFLVPIRKSIIRTWMIITAIPVVISLAYFIFKHIN